MTFFTVKALILNDFSLFSEDKVKETKIEWTVADDSRKLMFRTNSFSPMCKTISFAKSLPMFVEFEQASIAMTTRLSSFQSTCLSFLERSSKNYLSCSFCLGGSSPFGGGTIGSSSSVLVAEFLLLTQLTTVWCVFSKRLQIRLRVLSSLSSFDERLWL